MEKREDPNGSGARETPPPLPGKPRPAVADMDFFRTEQSNKRQERILTCVACA
jgi:hypothetical protein